MSDSPTELESSPAWAEQFVRFLDDGLTIPGTRLSIGFDGLIGMLVPVAGDAVTAGAALSLFWVAFQRGVPRAVLIRMAINVLLDALIGSVPFLGDIFDFGFKSNRRNLRLLERVEARPHKRAFSDYLVIGLFLLAIVALILLPFIMTGLVIAYVWRR